eukprot:TRINITY_DN1039_c0_g2_i1.p1 TRINITY_DN1039_c0_g2~~TRINITY_DN1039_c0_g2_i1.p1  ORF type:complete len:425 (-),score=136.90 TRINITY_DN1039_c0_g2_i1:2-1276(-)
MSAFENYNDPKNFEQIHLYLKKGDLIIVDGFPGKSMRGELSILPINIEFQAPCYHLLPSWYGLKNKEIRYRRRYLDLIVNKKIRDHFIIRSKVIKIIREFLDLRGFIEVETPILSSNAGGASATPFETFSKGLGTKLYLRIAPELFLKQLVIGGMERVYEIGKQFRNEGIDPSHNPEFTTCEFYQAYANCEILIPVTEKLLSDIIFKITGNNIIEINNVKETNDDKDESNTKIINFQTPFRRIDFISSIESKLDLTLPNLEEPDVLEKLIEICKKKEIFCPKPHTVARLLDKMFSQLVEPTCIQPTFVCNHPIQLSPLAKKNPNKINCVERFELFIAGTEICNAYSELNDPDEQRERFEQQAKDRDLGDNEAQIKDEEFCTALEYGLPPTAGWGMGIDRFCALLINAANIKDILLFPLIKSNNK